MVHSFRLLFIFLPMPWPFPYKNRRRGDHVSIAASDNHGRRKSQIEVENYANRQIIRRLLGQSGKPNLFGFGDFDLSAGYKY